jgi:hypothetical protein
MKQDFKLIDVLFFLLYRNCPGSLRVGNFFLFFKYNHICDIDPKYYYKICENIYNQYKSLELIYTDSNRLYIMEESALRFHQPVTDALDYWMEYWIDKMGSNSLTLDNYNSPVVIG